MTAGRALVAAAAWGGRDLRLLAQRENAVYAMQMADGTRAALRLHREGYQTEQAIRSELWWCGALAAAGVAVPTPWPSLAGDVLAGFDSGCFASVIAWADGAPMGAAGVPLAGSLPDRCANHRALGRLLAQMHSATDALTLPPGFQRHRWDQDGLLGDAPFWGRFWKHHALAADEAATLLRARDALRERLQSHLDAGGDFGLIHADVLRENVLVNDGSLTLIDFDDCGFGFRHYDLGTVMSQNLYEPQRDALCDALLDGYASLRPVDANMVAMFTLLRTLASVGWAEPRLAKGDPVHRSHINRALMYAAEVI